MAKDKRSKELFEHCKSGKKFSKKLHIKNALCKVLEIGMFAALGAMVIPEGIHAIKTSTGSYKTEAQITEDSKHFGANMEIAEIIGDQMIFNTTYKRMKHNGDKPIFVTISPKFSADEVEMLEQMLDYYEKLFADINANYCFEIVDGKKAIFEKMIGNTVISFDETGLMKDGNLGLNMLRANLINSNFFKTSRIFFNQDMTDAKMKYYVYVHEFAHAFGLSDVYLNNTPINHGDTFLNKTDIAVAMGMLYPNDVAILYAMYGEEYRDGDIILPEVLEEYQQRFESYKTKFFEKLNDVVRDTYRLTDENFNSIDASLMFDQKFCFNQYWIESDTNKLKECTSQLNFVDDKILRYVIKDDKDCILTDVETPYVTQGGMIFLPALHLPNGYASGTDNKECIQMVAIFNDNGQYKMADLEGLFVSNMNLIEFTSTSKDIDNKITKAILEDLQKPNEITLSYEVSFGKEFER